MRFFFTNNILQLPTCLTDRAAAPPPRSPYSVPDRTGGGSSSSDLSHIATSERWRAAYLIYRPMDLKAIESKASSGKYRVLEEFKADAQTIVHNVVIYHGGMCNYYLSLCVVVIFIARIIHNYIFYIDLIFNSNISILLFILSYKDITPNVLFNVWFNLLQLKNYFKYLGDQCSIY